MSLGRIDVNAFQSLRLRVGTVENTEALGPPGGLVEVGVDLGERRYRVLATRGSLPSYPLDRLIGLRVIVLDRIHPLTCSEGTYEATLLTAGESQQIVILESDLSNGTVLF